MSRNSMNRISMSLLCIGIASCQGMCEPPLEGGPVSLEPDDDRPVLTIEVGDSDEAGLLVQQVGLEIVRVDGTTLYFIEDASKAERLTELGYTPRPRNPRDVYRRVVRVGRSYPEEELVAAGIRVINREEGWVVAEGSLAQLRAVVAAGARIAAVSGHEPRPRQIRLVVPTREDVAKIGAMHVDIYSASLDREAGGILVQGAAFDDQIDRLVLAGYTPTIVPNQAVPQAKGVQP